MTVLAGARRWLVLVLVGMLIPVGFLLWQRTADADGQEVPASPVPKEQQASGSKVPKVTPERLRVEVVASYPPHPGAFTQGLLWHDGYLYESTGQWGESTVRRVDPRSGQVLASVELLPDLFGEGLALVGERLIQLTWQAGLAQVYDLESLVLVDQLTFEGEGWGLAWDGRRLVMSDGSSRLSFRDPADLSLVATLDVYLAGQPLNQLNELEVVDGQIYANVLYAERIVRIDPQTGAVTATIDAAGLLPPAARVRADALNGIAWDPRSKTFWITGKYWPKMFQVRFVPTQ